jgi:hypothetical protein
MASRSVTFPICKGTVKKTNQPCKFRGRYNGYCGHHRIEKVPILERRNIQNNQRAKLFSEQCGSSSTSSSTESTAIATEQCCSPVLTEQCCICQESGTNLVKMDDCCKSYFHSSCLGKWFDTKKRQDLHPQFTCPMCRYTFTSPPIDNYSFDTRHDVSMTEEEFIRNEEERFFLFLQTYYGIQNHGNRWIIRLN